MPFVELETGGQVSGGRPRLHTARPLEVADGRRLLSVTRLLITVSTRPPLVIESERLRRTIPRAVVTVTRESRVSTRPLRLIPPSGGSRESGRTQPPLARPTPIPVEVGGWTHDAV